MKTRLLILASLLISTSLFAQQFTNGTVRNVDARGGVAQAIGNRDGWFAWSVPMAGGGSICCWTDERKGCCGGCGLGGNRGWSINNHGDHPANGTRQIDTTDVTIAVEIEKGLVTRVQMFDSTCAVDGRGNEVTVLANVDPASSIAFLVDKARQTLGRHGNSVVGAIAQHAHASALPALERLAGPGQSAKIREDALFWIGQRGGERGFRFLRDFLHSNESTSLRKKAVFSLSQNQYEGAIAELISLARNDKTKEIRREAIFWLGQRAGTKAADELRRVVDEDPDDDVREHAVFAISQLPQERSVPMLMDLVRNHKSPGVRKKAMFWLAQTGDDRAIDMIEEILKK
jgi:hypothetical protein